MKPLCEQPLLLAASDGKRQGQGTSCMAFTFPLIKQQLEMLLLLLASTLRGVCIKLLSINSMMGVLFVIMNFLLSYFWASTPISGCWSWACWFVIQTAISPAAALQLCWFHIGDNNKQLGINFLWDDIQHHRWLWENSCGKNCTISLFLDSSAVVFRIRWWSWQLLV